MRHGETVSAFERELAAYCGAKYTIAAANGTVTLQAALIALGVTPGDRVATTPLTMSATSIAILNVGAVPVYRDVDPATWLMVPGPQFGPQVQMGVSLYGLHGDGWDVDDAAQTLRAAQSGTALCSSLSFQASKILSTGEGGALLTDDEGLAECARSYLSLGYRMSATQARIDSATLKSPTFDRHYSYPAINGRMNDVTARLGLDRLDFVDLYLAERRDCAVMYGLAIAGCDWLTPQHVPAGATHDYWSFAVACDTPERAVWLQARMAALGAEVPYGAWKLTYEEPAFQHLHPARAGYAHTGFCPNAESLQPRLLQFQTNHLASAETNARALRTAIQEAA